MLGLLNLLGEHIENKEEIAKTVDEYSHLVALIEESRAQCQVSLKPSQIGINVDFDFCLENCASLAKECASHGQNWLWIDMESSRLTTKTIELYTRTLSKYENCGVAIQAYLKRSRSDLEKLIERGAKIRLVKGAYNESNELAFKKKEEVRSNYAALLEMLFSSGRSFFAVATHDSVLVDLTKSLSNKYKVPNEKFEFEMLMGVRDSLKLRLVQEGYAVREYVPYGPQWLPYSIRRIREKKSNILLLLRSLFS